MLQFPGSRTEEASEDTKDLLKSFSCNDWCQSSASPKLVVCLPHTHTFWESPGSFYVNIIFPVLLNYNLAEGFLLETPLCLKNSVYFV